MFVRKKEFKALARDVEELKVAVASMRKKTVSETTTTPEKALSRSKIMDQWMNGEEGDEA